MSQLSYLRGLAFFLPAFLGMAALPGIRLSAQSSEAANAQAAEQDVASQVRELLRQLETDQVRTRDAAEKALVDLGPEVLPLLPGINSRTSGELKIRLQRIRQALDTQDIESFFEASIVTLQGTYSLQDAVQIISEQSGNEITLQGEDALAGIEVELDFDAAPFWNVMDAVISQGNLRINAFGTTGGDLVLSPGGQASSEAAFQSGPFRVEPIFSQATRQFNSQLPGQLQVSLLVTWEPRLMPVFMEIPMASVKATLADGVELAATNPQVSPEIPLNYGGCTTQIDLQLALPERSQTTLSDLVGEFVIAVPGESHKYEFKKFANGARQTQAYGDVTVVLEGARRNGKVFEMRVLIEFGNAQGALESYRGWVLSNQAYLLDAKGKRLENIGLNTYAMTNNAVGIAYLFQINGDPNGFTLVYESPASVSKQNVQYSLQNIPLP